MQRSARPTPYAEFTPATLDLYIYPGDTGDLLFEIADDDTGDPVDLSGASVLFQARATPRSDTAIIDLSTATSGIAVDGPAGEITITIPSTEDHAGAVMYYDLEITAAGTVTTYIAGRIHWRRDVSRGGA